MKQFTTTPEVIDLLRRGCIIDNTYHLPAQVDRSLYEAVNKVLVALGAKWSRKEGGHVFEYPIKDELDKVISTGIVTNWKKTTDFFHTPEAVALEMCGLLQRNPYEEFTLFDPSAGQGHLLDVVKANFHNVNILANELNPMHCQRLREKGYNPMSEDFMEIEPFAVDVILMNPPFTYEMEHIQHAYKFLADGGELITIASQMILSKNTKKGKAFKQWFDKMAGCDYAMNQNSFKESGTGVSTKMIVFNQE